MPKKSKKDQKQQKKQVGLKLKCKKIMAKEITPNTSSIVYKVWVFCNTLRDDGVGLKQSTNKVFK